MAQNHIGYLQEYCSKCKLKAPVYELLSETGRDHSKTFTYAVRIPSTKLNATATSNTKKLAKHACAKKLLQTCRKSYSTESSSEQPGLSTVSRKSLMRKIPPFTVHEQPTNQNNHVGNLQEYCTKAKIDLPVYKIEENKSGQVNMFTATAKIPGTSCKVTVNGKAKRSAKQKCSQRLLLILEQTKIGEQTSGIEGRYIRSDENVRTSKTTTEDYAKVQGSCSAIDLLPNKKFSDASSGLKIEVKMNISNLATDHHCEIMSDQLVSLPCKSDGVFLLLKIKISIYKGNIVSFGYGNSEKEAVQNVCNLMKDYVEAISRWHQLTTKAKKRELTM